MDTTSSQMRLIADPPQGAKKSVTLPFKMGMDTSWEKWRGWTFWEKEPETLKWIRDFDKKSAFWDIGANIGVYSLYCAAVHPSVSIYAFDPLYSNFEAIKKNFFTNGFESTLFPVALSDKNYHGFFNAKYHEAGSSGGQISDTGDPIMVFSGDKIASWCGVYPDYVKIDVDGLEFKVLSGMRKILKKCRSILVEMNQDCEKIAELLTTFGFIPDDLFNQYKVRENDHNVIWSK